MAFYFSKVIGRPIFPVANGKPFNDIGIRLYCKSVIRGETYQRRMKNVSEKRSIADCVDLITALESITRQYILCTARS